MTAEQRTIEERWIERVEMVEKCFNEMILSKRSSHLPPSRRHQVALKEYWKSVSRLLTDYVAYKVSTGVGLTPFPIRELMSFASVAEDLGDGKIPDIVANASTLGHPYYRGTRNEIARAVFFLDAVAEKQLKCRNPTTTVATHFDVTPQTVRNWKRDRDRICDGIWPPHPNLIEEVMRDAGLRYRGKRRGGSR